MQCEACCAEHPTVQTYFQGSPLEPTLCPECRHELLTPPVPRFAFHERLHELKFKKKLGGGDRFG